MKETSEDRLVAWVANGLGWPEEMAERLIADGALTEMLNANTYGPGRDAILVLRMPVMRQITAWARGDEWTPDY